MTKCIARYIAHVIPLARARSQSLDYLSGGRCCVGGGCAGVNGRCLGGGGRARGRHLGDETPKEDG